MHKHSRYDLFFGNRPKDQLSRGASQAFKQANGQEEIESILSGSWIRNNRFSLFCRDFLSIVENCHIQKMNINTFFEVERAARWRRLSSSLGGRLLMRLVCDNCHLKVELSSVDSDHSMIFKRTHGESLEGILVIILHTICKGTLLKKENNYRQPQLQERENARNENLV